MVGVANLTNLKRNMKQTLKFAERNFPQFVAQIKAGKNEEMNRYYNYYKNHGGKLTLLQILKHK